jgi:hypothetical protein
MVAMILARASGCEVSKTGREKNGTTHEFQANRDTLQDMKPGDQIEAKLREAPKC